MAYRVATAAAIALIAVGSALAHGTDERRQALDEKIAQLREKISAAERREGVLTSEISAVTAKIRALESDVTDVSARLATLESELALHQRRLARVSALLDLQTRKLRLMRRQHAIAQRQLSERLVAIYQSERPTAVEVVLAASSLGDVLDQLEYLDEIGQQDRRVADQVAVAKRSITLERARTARLRSQVATATQAVAVRTAAQRAERDRLLASQHALAHARAEKRDTLAAVQATKEEFLHEVAGLERASAALAARIQAAQGAQVYPSTGYDSTPSASGLIWPVAGPVTSGYGWRWGRMHEGIDIAAPAGAPIQAAASGTVIYAGWMSGYGNLVVVDHGGGLATAYAHMSSIGAAVGQHVVQGQVIGYVGCTGHCFGNHLHFEVRVNGAAVDPLGYL